MGTVTPETRSPGSSKSPPGAFCTTSPVWNSGWWDSDRDGFSTSTRCSNGTSWCAYADSAVSRTRPNSSTKLGSPLVSVRSTRVLMKKPTSSSRASSVRPAIGEPIAMSVPAPSRVYSAASAA